MAWFNPVEAAKAAFSYTPAGQAYKAISGNNTDYDVFGNYSVKGGDKSPYDGSFVGPTVAPSVEGSNTPGALTDGGSGAAYNPNGGDGGAGGAGGERQYTPAEEQQFYTDQIAALDKILGGIGGQKNSGLARLATSFTDQSNLLGDQRIRANSGYDAQGLENQQAKLAGFESVDTFARNSDSNLKRLLGGAGAGKSSVAQSLIPYLISKGAGARRSGVVDTAGRNERDIDTARTDANYEFDVSETELGKQRKSQEDSFNTSILNQENDLLAKKADLEFKKAQATGAGYNDAKAAAAGSQAEIDRRTSDLNALFTSFSPTFTPRQTNLTTPELGQYTVDPGQIRSEGKGPSESSYYGPMFKKKKQQY